MVDFEHDRPYIFQRVDEIPQALFVHALQRFIAAPTESVDNRFDFAMVVRRLRSAIGIAQVKVKTVGIGITAGGVDGIQQVDVDIAQVELCDGLHHEGLQHLVKMLAGSGREQQCILDSCVISRVQTVLVHGRDTAQGL